MERVEDIMEGLVRHLITSGPAFHAAVDREGLTTSQFVALGAIAAAPTDCVSINQIACQMRMSVPSASRAVSTLLAKGLVTRDCCQDDRRRREVRILPNGTDVLCRVTRDQLHGAESFLRTAVTG